MTQSSNQAIPFEGRTCTTCEKDGMPYCVCDHPDVTAVARVAGEVDSFGDDIELDDDDLPKEHSKWVDVTANIHNKAEEVSMN